MRILSPRDILNSASTPLRQLQSPTLPVYPAGNRPNAAVMLWRTVVANCFAVILPTVAAFVLAVLAVNFLFRPSYSSDARILLDVHAGADSRSILDRPAIDTEIQNQIQILMSRDFARDVIKINKLAENPEFDPILRGVSPIRSLLALTGFGSDPFRMTPEERVLAAWFERLEVRRIGQSSVIKVVFRSRDPELAAKVARSVANRYAGMKPSEIRRPAVQIIALPIVSNTSIGPNKPVVVLTLTLCAFLLSLLCVLRTLLFPAADDPASTARATTP